MCSEIRMYINNSRYEQTLSLDPDAGPFITVFQVGTVYELQGVQPPLEAQMGQSYCIIFFF